MSRRRGALLAIAGAAVLLTGFLWLRPGTPQGSGEEVAVERRAFQVTVTAVGVIKPEIGAEVRVGSRISGRVKHLRANVGDPVRKDDIIAELETDELDALVAQRRAELGAAEARRAALEATAPEELARAEADTAAAEASARLATSEWERQQAMFRDRATSQADVDLARERYVVAGARRDAVRRALGIARTAAVEGPKQARAEEARARAALRSAEVDRSFATIRAPISGVVASVATQEGETVAAGLNAPTFLTIVDLDRLHVHAYVDEVDIGKLAVGQEAAFTVDAFPARDLAGRIAAIYPSATLQDNVVKYIVAIAVQPDSAVLLRPEMTAGVRIRLESRTVPAVPARAVRRDRGETVVFVRSGRSIERVPVRLGWRDGSWVEVVSGVREGQRVLVNPPAPEPEPAR
jgi:macrolide-specific efflux system membrane fusion protein